MPNKIPTCGNSALGQKEKRKYLVRFLKEVIKKNLFDNFGIFSSVEFLKPI